MTQGWVAPKTDAEVRKQFFDKHGEDQYTRELDRRWRRIGRQVEAGARIPEGRLGV